MKKVQGIKLYLKEIEEAELTQNVIAWFDDIDLMRYYTNSKKKITKDSFIQSLRNGKDIGNLYTYGIYFNEDDKLIGTIKLGPINFIHKTSDLVALIGDRDFLGKGLSVEAIRLGNELAFKYFDLRKLYGGMYLSNIPSIKAYSKAGWIVEGRLKGQFLNNGQSEDRILVGCFNEKYFTTEEIEKVKRNEHLFFP